MGDCAVEGCSSARSRRDWCNKHYLRWRRHGDPHVFVPLNWTWGTLYEKLEKHCLRTEGGCLLWPFSRDKDGYGKFRISGSDLRVSRAILMHATGVTGQVAMHKCDTPSCAEVSHLRWGTWSENAQDSWDKGRAAMNFPRHKGERNGRSKLTDAERVLIKQRRLQGEKQKDLAVEFEVSTQTIRAAERLN